MFDASESSVLIRRDCRMDSRSLGTSDPKAVKTDGSGFEKCNSRSQTQPQDAISLIGFETTTSFLTHSLTM